jgi:hypothetical protein
VTFWQQFDGGLPRRDAFGNQILTVTIPSDDRGYLGRQCPSCERMFRVHETAYDALPDAARMTCPYCGHGGEIDEYITPQQWARIEQAALNAAGAQVSDFLRRSLPRPIRPASGLSVTFTVPPYHPDPLPGIREEALIRERQCPDCGARYAVFHEHRFCPVSGALSPSVVADDALAAQEVQLDVVSALPPGVRAMLREQGGLGSLYVSTLIHVVSIVEVLASATFRARVSNAEAVLRGKGQSPFQRLEALAELYAEYLKLDVRSTAGIDWPEVTRLWALRHVHVHAGGLVDDRFLRLVPDSPLRVGQRVVVSEADARNALTQARLLRLAILMARGS